MNPLFLAPFPRSHWPGAGARKRRGAKSPFAARTVLKEGPVKRRGLSAISVVRRGNRGKSPPRQTALSQCHNRGEGRPISDTTDAAVVTSVGGNGRNRPIRHGQGILSWRMPLTDGPENSTGAGTLFQMHIALSTLIEGGFPDAHELSALRKSSGERARFPTPHNQSPAKRAPSQPL